MSSTVVVYGLGSMGQGMANSLVAAGHKVFGADPSTSALDAFTSAGGYALADLTDWSQVSAIVSVVVNADQTEQVLFGSEGAVPKLNEGTVVISCATISPTSARRFAQTCAAQGVHYLDAPISGGSVKAAEGALTVMASGTSEAFEKARPVLDATAERVFELGESAGAGSAMKAVNQLLAGVHIATMAEAIALALSQGVSADKVLEVIPQCAGSSWMFENRAPHIVAGDYTPHSAMTIWPKDLGIVQAIAAEAGLQTPITKTALEQYEKAVQAGLGAQDDAAVVKVYAKQAKLELP